MREIKYEVIREIGILSENRTISVELNVVSWSDDDPKYDIRRWNKNSRTALKGIALSREEVEALFELLKEELEQE